MRSLRVDMTIWGAVEGNSTTSTDDDLIHPPATCDRAQGPPEMGVAGYAVRKQLQPGKGTASTRVRARILLLRRNFDMPTLR